ncbi:MAG: Fe-S cluster assembly protein SufD [Gammaproteobacteria bacterium]|nr:Fe-S cluster assembly protein SufD [Gammaproteobacteria bacterium]
MKQLNKLATPFASVAEALIAAEGTAPWLKKRRQDALTQFNMFSLPAKKEEDWKYTSLWDFSQQIFNHHTESVEIVADEVDSVALLHDAYRVVIVDGVFLEEFSDIDALQSGLCITALSESVDQLEHSLGQQTELTKVGLNALNTMLMSEGVIISVDSAIEIEKIIEIIVINTGNTANLATHLRHKIELETGAKATVIEHYVGLTQDGYFTDVVTEVNLAERAELTHYKLQQESNNAFHIATLAAHQAQASQWLTNNISLGAKLARNDVHSQLLGEQSHVTMDGLYLVDGEQHIDNHTRIDHAVPNTSSDELYKGVLDGNSHAVFNGKVMVHKDAQKTDANQSNRNLLLSRGCEIDSKPEMEIYADDVKCGHGSAIGQLDEDQLFFLRARGLDEVGARSLLTYAFAVEVLTRIPNHTIREALANVVEQRLPKTGEKE